MRSITFEIHGSPQSKANSRRLVFRGGKMASIKSIAALAYVESFKRQCPTLEYTKEGLISGDVFVQIDIWYQSWRSDLDESIILDCMQGYIYHNDRQVKVKHVTHCGVDKERPRATILVTEIPNVKKKQGAKQEKISFGSGIGESSDKATSFKLWKTVSRIRKRIK
jgi:hypothetical protein